MIVAYVRVSKDKQFLENQEFEIQRYEKEKCIVIDRWVLEKIAGTKEKELRKLGKLLNSLKTGDTLIVTELSRLGRTFYEVIEIMGKCIKDKVIVHETKNGYTFDDSLNSKLLIFVFSIVAEMERDFTSQRTKEALAYRKKMGVILGRRKGYSPKIRILKKNKKDIILKIKDGKTILSICKLYGVGVDTFRIWRRDDKEINKLILNRQDKRISA